jgi:hypothetical protein
LRPALEGSWVLWAAALVQVSDRGATWASAGAALLAWLPVIAGTRVAGLAEDAVGAPWWRARAAAIQVTLAVMTGLAAAADLHGAARLAGCGALAAVAFGVWRWSGAGAARAGGLSVVVVGGVAAWLLTSTAAAQGWGPTLFAILVAGGVVTAVALLVDRNLEAPVRRRLRWLTSVAGLTLLLRAFAVQRGELADYATVAWGLLAVATFLLGLFARSKPHRLTGLAGLALCVGRAFMVDLHSTLHRIAAFVALGLVLLWVGFSYHRFRHLVTEDEKKL